MVPHNICLYLLLTFEALHTLNLEIATARLVKESAAGYILLDRVRSNPF